MFFKVTFSKYSDDTVYLDRVEVVPTWVNLNTNNGSRQYNIVALNDSTRDQWKETYNMTENEFNAAQRSYDRTIALVNDGVVKVQEYLDQQKQEREEFYLAQAQNAAA